MQELGPHARRWMYHRFLAAPQLADTNSWHAPVRERQMFAAFFVPMRWVGKRYLNVTPESAAASERVVWRTFDEVGERLADGRPYLAGERFGVEDLTFACMAAAVLVPPHYGVPLPQPGAGPPRGVVARGRGLPAPPRRAPRAQAVRPRAPRGGRPGSEAGADRS